MTSYTPMQPRRGVHYAFLGLLMGLLLIPVIATALYAISAQWSRTILPQVWTLQPLLETWTNPRFLRACLYSLALSTGTAMLSIAIIFPVLLSIHTTHPWWQRWVQPILVLPFALPPVVATVSLMQLYAVLLRSFNGTVLVIVACYFAIVLPFVYRAIDNNLRAIAVQDLMAASALLGASRMQTLFYVLLPNLKHGFLIAFFIAIAFLIGEFVFINILASGYMETIPVYLYSLKTQSGHLSSAVVISYFALMLCITTAVGWLSREKKHV